MLVDFPKFCRINIIVIQIFNINSEIWSNITEAQKF